MPGRFVYWMNVSVDLLIEHAPDEQGGGSWMSIGDSLHREFNRRAQAMSMLVEGRRIYETMESFWPSARHDQSLSEVVREYGEIWTSKPKRLISRTRTEAQYNTEVIGGDDAITQLAALRANTEGDLGVGGATLATALLHAGLLDEVMLFTHPVVLGRGRPLFDSVTAPIELELIEQQTYAGGVTLHRYGVSP